MLGVGRSPGRLSGGPDKRQRRGANVPPCVRFPVECVRPSVISRGANAPQSYSAKPKPEPQPRIAVVRDDDVIRWTPVGEEAFKQRPGYHCKTKIHGALVGKRKPRAQRSRGDFSQVCQQIIVRDRYWIASCRWRKGVPARRRVLMLWVVRLPSWRRVHTRQEMSSARITKRILRSGS